MKITHSLYGEKDFIILPIAETDCSQCIHSQTCTHKKEKVCINYQLCNSGEQGCSSCIHHFTRYHKNPILCFYCAHFEPEAYNFPLYKELIGKHIRLDDEFESVHIWTKELAIKNAGRWIPTEITKKKYEEEVNTEKDWELE